MYSVIPLFKSANRSTFGRSVGATTRRTTPGEVCFVIRECVQIKASVIICRHLENTVIDWLGYINVSIPHFVKCTARFIEAGLTMCTITATAGRKNVTTQGWNIRICCICRHCISSFYCLDSSSAATIAACGQTQARCQIFTESGSRPFRHGGLPAPRQWQSPGIPKCSARLCLRGQAAVLSPTWNAGDLPRARSVKATPHAQGLF